MRICSWCSKPPNSISVEVSRSSSVLSFSDLTLELPVCQGNLGVMNVKISSPQRLQRPLERLVPNPKLKFMDQCREVMRFNRLALRSEEAYLQWIKRFLVFHRGKAEKLKTETLKGKDTSPRPAPHSSDERGEGARSDGWRRPEEMGEAEVQEFLTYLAAERNVAASTQNQALGALLFMYQKVLGRELTFMAGFERAQRRQKVPVVLSREEVQQLLAAVPERYRLFWRLLYGTGIRLMEGLRLRVHP